MIDYEIIINGVVAGLATENFSDKKHHETTNEHLYEIKHLLREQRDYTQKVLLHLPKETRDIYKIQTLVKVGTPYISNTDNRQYTRILVPTQTILNITSVLGIFTLTVPAATWTSLDLPDRSTVLLDSTNTASSQQVYLRYTDQHP